MDKYIEHINADHHCLESAPKVTVDTTYHLNLSVFFRKDGFQEICVLGNIPELGVWKVPDTKFWMKWTEGDIWVLEKPIITKREFFTFKFAMADRAQNKLIQYERGVDRICDLELLPDRKVAQAQSPQESHSRHQHSLTHTHNSYTKYCSLDNLEWESFFISFSISHLSLNGDECVVLTGNRDEVKNKKLEKIQRPIDWMHSKYGDHTQPWELTIKMPNIEGGVDGVWADDAKHKDFNYTYGIQKLYSSQTMWERAINRQMVLQNAGTYQGQLGIRKSRFWLNTDIVYIVNGRVDMADGNFIGPFHIEKIGETGIFLGPYPQAKQDFDKILEKQVTAVFDIQNKEDHRSLNIDLNKQRHQYYQRGIETIKYYEVTDDVEAEYCHCLFEAAKILNDLVNVQGHKVFVNCTTGVSRSPTLMIVYLALFIQHDSWDDLEKIHNFILGHYPYQDPNLSIAQILIDTKRDFQQNNLREKQDKENATAERNARIEKHSGIADEIEKVKQAIKDVDNQLLMDQNTHNQKLAAKPLDLTSLQSKQQKEVEELKKRNQQNKARREQELKDKKDANERELEELRNRKKGGKEQESFGSDNGANPRLQQLIDEIEQNKIKWKEKKQDLKKEYERKQNELKLKELEENQNSNQLKNQQQQPSASELELTYINLQKSHQNVVPLEDKYRQERESLEKRIQEFIMEKTGAEEKERKSIIEITQKESEWNLYLMKEQEQINSRKISIMHKSSQHQMQELELEQEKRMQQSVHDSNQRVRIQEQEIELNLKLQFDELEKRRKFQNNEERLQKQQFDDHKNHVESLQMELDRKLKYEYELRTKQIQEQEVVFKKKWLEEMKLKQKLQVEEDERKRRQIMLQIQDRQQEQQDEIDQWKEYQQRMDAERMDLREREEREWIEQMQEERVRRLEAKRVKILEAENRRKLAQEKKKTQVTQKLPVMPDWDDQEIARMEATKKLRMVEIQKKKQQYLDSLKACHPYNDISQNSTNNSRLQNSIHRHRSIEADRFKKIENTKINLKNQEQTLRRNQTEAEIESRRRNLQRKPQVPKLPLYVQQNQSHIMKDMSRLSEQQVSGRLNYNEISMPTNLNDMSATIEFEKRHVKQSMQAKNEMNSFNKRDRNSLAAMRQNLQKSQQLSQTRSLLKPPTPVNNKDPVLNKTPLHAGRQPLMNNDLFSSQKKPVKLAEQHSDRNSTANQVIMDDESNQNVQELKIETPSESEDQPEPVQEDYLQEEEINRLSQELFTTVPIKFKQRRNNEIDSMIQATILAKGIKIPIIWIKDDLYLIGHQRMNCSIKRACLMLRVGGGYEPFQEYIVHNEGYFMRQLIVHIIKSQQTLDEVIQSLLKGQKIRNVYQEAQQKGFTAKRQTPQLQQNLDQVQGLPNLKSLQPVQDNIDPINRAQDSYRNNLISDRNNFFDIKQESIDDGSSDRRHNRKSSLEKPSSPLKQQKEDEQAFPEQQKPSIKYNLDSKPEGDNDQSNALLQKQLDELQVKYESLKQEPQQPPPASENILLQEQLQTLQTKYESLNQLYSQSQAIEENREHLKSIKYNLESFLKNEFQSNQLTQEEQPPIPEHKSQHTVQKVSVISQEDLMPQPRDKEFNKNQLVVRDQPNEGMDKRKKSQSMVEEQLSKVESPKKQSKKQSRNEPFIDEKKPSYIDRDKKSEVIRSQKSPKMPKINEYEDVKKPPKKEFKDDEKQSKEYSVKQSRDYGDKADKKSTKKAIDKERTRDKDKERSRDKDKEKTRGKDKERSRNKDKERSRDDDKEKARDIERQQAKDYERQKEKEKQKDKEKQRDKERSREGDREREKIREKEKELKRMEKMMAEQYKKKGDKHKDKDRRSKADRSRDHKNDQSDRKVEKRSKRSSDYDRSKEKKSKKKESSSKRYEKRYSVDSSSSDDHRVYYKNYKERSRSSSSSDEHVRYKYRQQSSSSSDDHHYFKVQNTLSDGHHHNVKKSSNSSDGHRHKERIYKNDNSSSDSDKKSLKSLQKSLSIVLEKSDIIQHEFNNQSKEMIKASPSPQKKTEKESYVTISSNQGNIKERQKSPFKKNFTHFLSTYKVYFQRPLDEIWDQYDSNNNGELSKETTRKFLNEVCKNIQEDRAKNYDPENFDNLYEQFDADQNGLMSKMEMAQFIKLAFKKQK